MFIHCISKCMTFKFHWNKNRWELLEFCIPNFCEPSKKHKPKLWKFIVQLRLLNCLPN